jgi:hypothetical protein
MGAMSVSRTSSATLRSPTWVWFWMKRIGS